MFYRDAIVPFVLSFGNAGRLETFGTDGDGCRLPRERFGNGLHYTPNAIIIHVHYPSAHATAKPRRRILQKIRPILSSRFSGGDVTMKKSGKPKANVTMFHRQYSLLRLAMMAGAVGLVSPLVTSLWAEDPSTATPFRP